MSDATLLILGCAATFTAAAGAYIAIRSGFDRDVRPAYRAPAALQPVRTTSRRRRDRAA